MHSLVPGAEESGPQSLQVSAVFDSFDRGVIQPADREQILLPVIKLAISRVHTS